MVQEKKESIPTPKGILIFDEMKVGGKVHYHAKTQKLIGLVMSSDDLGSIQDLYQTLRPGHRTQVIICVAVPLEMFSIKV